MTGVPDEVALDAILSFQKEDSRREESKRDADLARRSFRDFIRLGWSQVEPTRKLVQGWHVDAIADHLQAVYEGKIRRLLICVPPGSAKSILTAVMFPAWVWTSNPGWRATFASYDAALSTRDSVRCRDLMQSQWYQETFSPEWRFSPAQNEKTYYTNTAKGFRVSTSVGGRGTGWRGSAVICDDILNIKDEHSDAALEQVIHWWDNVIYNRLDNPDTGAKIIIMQRISDRDLAGHVLREGGYDHLMIPNEYEPERTKVTSIGWRDPRTKRGELMCAEVISQSATDDFKRKERRYSSQYQQNPTSDGAGILKSHCWNYWQPRGAAMRAIRVRMPDGTFIEKKPIDLPEKFDVVVQAWDLAFKDTSSKSDYVAGGVMAARGADRFMLDLIHERLDFVATIKAIRTMSANGWGAQARVKLIEDAANGPAVISSLKHEIPGITPVRPEGGKVSRIRAASPEQASGNWYLPHPDLFTWVGDPANPSSHGMIAECSAFPNGAHDDICLAAGTKIATKWGDKAIEDIRPGDAVLTPFGLRHVLNSGQTGTSPLVSFAGLSGTPGHKVFTGADFNRIDSLTQESLLDRLSLCGLIRWKSQQLLCSMESPTDSWEAGRNAITSVSLSQMRGGVIRRAFMSLSGKNTMGGRLRRVRTFTIGIIILSTTTLRIWSLYRTGNILNFIRTRISNAKSGIWSRFAPCLLLGTSLPREENGIDRTPKPHGRSVPRWIRNALGVARSLLPSGPMLSIAGSGAGTSIDGLSVDTITPQTVSHVEKSSWLKKMRAWLSQKSHVANHAHSHLGSLAEPQPVYNLNVEGDHVYYANGILVSNCDAWAYGATRINQERTSALFPMSEIDIVIEPPTRIPPGWQRCFGMSVSWDEIALVWICQDPESKRYIAYAEVSQPPADPAMHAAAALAIGRWIPGVMSPTGTGRERADWLMLTETYRKFGLDVDFAPEVSETGIAEIRTALQNGSLKVSSNLANFIEQYRGYRRDDHGALPKYNAGVINALRTAWQWGRERMRPEPGPPAPPAIQLNRRGGNADSGGAGWML